MEVDGIGMGKIKKCSGAHLSFQSLSFVLLLKSSCNLVLGRELAGAHYIPNGVFGCLLCV